MAGAPPSSLGMERSSSSGAGGGPTSYDDTTGGSGSSTSREQHYGDEGIDLDLSSLTQSYTRTDKGKAERGHREGGME